MRRPWRIIGLSGGVAAVLVGALLIMGSFDSEARLVAERELGRVENFARSWESRLESARSKLRDLLLRFDMGEILEHPQEFGDGRIRERLTYVYSAWPMEIGELRGLLLFSYEGLVHTFWGDTLGASLADRMLRSQRVADMLFLPPSNGSGNRLAIRYRVPADNLNPNPGYIVALLDPRGVLEPVPSSLQKWKLCSGDGSQILPFTDSDTPSPSAGGAWPALHSRNSGVLYKTVGSSLVFSKVRVPGMAPLLLVNSLPSRATSSVLAMALFLAGTISVLVASRGNRSFTLASFPQDFESPSDEAAVEAISYRSIFQNLGDPICVVNSSGRVVRANRDAEELLQFHRKDANADYVVTTPYGEKSVQEFLTGLASSTDSQEILCRISINEKTLFTGSVALTRFHGKTDGSGPVLLHFQYAPELAAYDSYARSEYERIPDPQSPYPVVYVTPEGLIQLFNDAALKACPRIKETPVIADVLPSLEARELNRLLGSSTNASFESLFGSTPHSFEVVPVEDGVLLYAHPLSASQTLEVALRQSLENFNSLCAVMPLPVMLVDPRNHAVTDANPAARELFKLPVDRLQGRILDTLSPNPVDLAVSHQDLVIDTPSGLIPCRAHFEMLKVEGVPMILVVLQPPADSYSSLATSLAKSEYISLHLQKSLSPPPVPPGPALVISLNPVVRDVARRLLERTGHACEVFSSLDDATAWLYSRNLRPELIALDIGEFLEAADWLETVRLRCGNVACLAITDGVTYGLTDEGPNAYLIKPFDQDTVVEALNYLGLPVEMVETEPPSGQ